MFDAEANASAQERVNRRVVERTKAAYKYMLKSKDGRAFLSAMLRLCHVYDPVDSEVDEGTRRAGLMLRNTAYGLGFVDEWQKAEKEDMAFQQECQQMLEATEAKEE